MKVISFKSCSEWIKVVYMYPIEVNLVVIVNSYGTCSVQCPAKAVAVAGEVVTWFMGIVI